MNEMIEIIMRWLSYPHVFHTDIAKCYNSAKLDKSHRKYHLYVWQENLDPTFEPIMKVLKTFIYGLKSSGNIVECAIRKTAEINKNTHPKAFKPIHEGTYVDDCMWGIFTLNEMHDIMEQILLSLSKIWFNLKGFTVSWEKHQLILLKMVL